MKLKLMCLAVAAAFAEGAAAQALPTGGTVTQGSATINTPTSTSMQINQTSARAVIDWSTFNIGNGASVNFAQPSATSVAVNRVGAGAGASTINGILGANGNVMILNPNGVMFGANAVVNVAGLIASTGNIDDAQFMAGGAFAITGATGGSISNDGNITISGAGLAAFVAPSVSNSGVITASTGRINLASAQAATVSFNGGLYELAIDQGVANGSITNSGTLSGGTIVISALDAANVVSGVINLEGIQQANRIEVHGGEVVLKSDLNATTVTGTSRDIEVCDCAQIQDAVNIAKVGTPGAGATINVEGGSRTEQVTINKPYLTLTGSNNATLNVGAGQTGFTVAADGVTVEGMKVVGPYSQPYSSVNWDAEPGITAGFTINANVSDATIRNNDIRNLRAGVLMLGSAPNARMTGNLIDNTKGSILVRSNGALISGNQTGPLGSEWDIVFLNGITDGAYFTSPHVSEQQYGAGVMAMSADNGGMKVLDRRYGSNGLLGQTPQFGNRSHIVVNAGSSFTAADDFNLGNGLGNARQPLGSIGTGIDAAVWGGFVDVKAGTYAQSSTLNVDKSLTLRGAGEAQTIIDARTVSGYGMLVNADNVTLSDFTFHGPTANVGTAYGIKVQPAGSAASSRLNNFSISRVTSRGAGRAELDLNGVVGATIDHFTAQGENTAGAGIQITDSANVTISNSTTQGNNWGGVALFQANRFFDQQNNNITVQSNNTFHEANPLYLQDESASRDFGALSLQGFDYAVRNSTNTQYTWLQYELSDATAFAVGNGAPLSSTIQGWNGSAATQDFHVGAGMSIMQAVNTAAAGGRVSVRAGLYAEDVAVNQQRSLTFDGVTLSSFTVNAPGSGIAGSATANGAGGFTFNAPIVLLGDTSLTTTGASIAFNSDIQGAGGAAFNLTLDAGTGNIFLTSGGSAVNPLGRLDAASNNFTLAGTLWVSGYEIDALGTVALSDSTLRSLGAASNSIEAGGDVTGSTVSQGPVAIDSGGEIVMANVVSQSTIVIQAAETIQIANIETPVSVALIADGPVTVSGSAPVIAVDAPSGSITGGFGDVVNSGAGIIEVNGRAEVPQTVSSGIDASRVVPRDGTPAAGEASASEEGSGELYFSTEENERRRVQIVRRTAAGAGAVLERGMGVELDLNPGRSR